MSSTGDHTRSLASSMKRLWSLGGVPAYYRGLTVRVILVWSTAPLILFLFRLASLVRELNHLQFTVNSDNIGVFPYSAIDMSTFEALKLAYLRSTAKEEPGVMAILAFGSISGSIGATSVYPLNLVRTRLQASGSSGHPQKYTGVWDVAAKTLAADGWRGFYRGLFPTLAKVSCDRTERHTSHSPLRRWCRACQSATSCTRIRKRGWESDMFIVERCVFHFNTTCCNTAQSVRTERTFTVSVAVLSYKKIPFGSLASSVLPVGSRAWASLRDSSNGSS